MYCRYISCCVHLSALLVLILSHFALRAVTSKTSVCLMCNRPIFAAFVKLCNFYVVMHLLSFWKGICVCCTIWCMDSNPHRSSKYPVWNKHGLLVCLHSRAFSTPIFCHAPGVAWPPAQNVASHWRSTLSPTRTPASLAVTACDVIRIRFQLGVGAEHMRPDPVKWICKQMLMDFHSMHQLYLQGWYVCCNILMQVWLGFDFQTQDISKHVKM